MNTRLFLLPLALLTSVAVAQVPYAGNDCFHGVTRPHGVVDPYTGNSHFSTRDIVVSGAVGSYGLVWGREANSRTTESEPWFGLGHNWTDTWQWEMVDEGTDSQGRPMISVRQPDGWCHIFTETSPGRWWSAPSVGDRIISDGDSFILIRYDGSEVHFVCQQTPAGETFYASEVVDPEGNIWNLSYSAGRLVQITEPAGRWLRITYSTIAAPSAAAGVEPYTVITQVSASDGQVVKYDYSFPDDADYPVLTGVEYPDGTAATYTYEAPHPSARLLLEQAVDTKAPQRIRGRVFHYFSETDAASGQLAEVTTAGTGAILWALKPGDSGQRSYAITEDNGATTYQSYNAGGNLAETIDGLGYAKKYQYDYNGLGFVVVTTDALGNVTREVNAADGRPVKKIRPDGSMSSWARDDHYRVLSTTNELGNTTTYSRDVRGRIVQVSYPDGSTAKFTYNDLGEIVTRIDRGGAVSTMSYDSRGLLQKVTNALENSSSFAYDAHDRISAITDPRGNITKYQRDAAGRVTKTIYDDGSSSDTDYDAYGHIVKTIDATGIASTIEYDQFGRIVGCIGPLGHETKFVYTGPDAGSPFTQPANVILPSGRETTTNYDADGHVVARTIALGTPLVSTTRYTYDATGHLISTIDPRGGTTRYFYDDRGRQIKMIDALGHAATFTYDALGQKLSETDANGNTTKWTYDSMGHELTMTDALGAVTTHRYNSAGNLVSLSDANGNTYRFEHDALGRPKALIYPDGSQESYTYDAAGNKASFTNRAGDIQTFSYNSRNREVRSSWSDGSQTIVKAYDAAGRMTLEDNGVSKITYTYDAAGRLASESQDLSSVVTDGTSTPAPQTVSYTYTEDGQRSTIGYPDGTSVAYTYNARGQLQDILGNGVQPPIASYTYDAAGNAIQIPRENLTETEQTYDATDHTTAIEDQGTGGPLEETNYTYNKVNNRTSATMTVYSASRPKITRDRYMYDADNQVTGADYAAPVIGGLAEPAGAPVETARLTYDPVGNRVQVNEDGKVTSYMVNELNQYTQVGMLSPSYDRNGNLASIGQWIYRYDALNRLVSATNAVMNAKFYYDARNRCVARSYNGVTTLNYYDNWNLIEQNDATGAETGRYVFGRRVDEMVLLVNQHGVFYPHYDALGNVTMLTDAGGRMVERYAYTADGKVTIQNAAGDILNTSALGNRWMYTGREWLREVGLYDFRHRMYSADLGRFLQTDPIRFLGGDINIYRYVHNDFVNVRDVNGEGIIGAVIDGVIGGIGGAMHAMAQGGTTWNVVTDAAIGAVAGATIGALDPTDGILSNSAVGAAVNGAVDYLDQVANRWENTGVLSADADWGSVAESAVAGFVGGGIEASTKSVFLDLGADTETAEGIGSLWGSSSDTATGMTLQSDPSLSTNINNDFAAAASAFENYVPTYNPTFFE